LQHFLSVSLSLNKSHLVVLNGARIRCCHFSAHNFP
jgi:hypothetical protein